MPVVFSNQTFPVGHMGRVTVVGNAATVEEIFISPAIIDGSVTNPGDPLTADLTGFPIDITATGLDSPEAIVLNFGGDLWLFSLAPQTVGQVFTFANATLGDFVPCFAAGTRILTRRGEVAVEDLEVGDEALALLRGGFSRVAWIGQRRMRCAATPRPADHWPLRVREGAFGPHRPHRDLLLSPDHAVHVDGNLIPIRYLENGATVVRAPMAEVTYFHVELERHDVLIAEGLSAESYLDTGNRADFDGTARDPARAGSDEAAARRIWAERACAPLHVRGPVVAAARRMLEARMAEMGLDGAPDPGLRLVVDGQDILPRRFGDAWQFDLPAQVGGARLVSTAHIPAVTAPLSGDRRCLGVPVARLLIDGRPVPVDAPFLRGGWHAPEDGLRWTNGMASLPPLRTLTVLLAPIPPRGMSGCRADVPRLAASGGDRP
jgi:hypothetical protein